MNKRLGMNPRTSLVTFCTLALVTACGRGGSDASVPASPPAVTPAVTPAFAPARPVVTPISTVGSTCGHPDFAATALARINQLRAAGADCRGGGNFAPAVALGWSPLLTQAAEAHSQDMVAKSFFSHTGSSGSSLAERVNATGYAWSNLGENIAAGYPGIDKVMDGWIASDGHCANLMNPAFDQVGLACVPGSAANNRKSYWTINLARSR